MAAEDPPSRSIRATDRIKLFPDFSPVFHRFFLDLSLLASRMSVNFAPLVLVRPGQATAKKWIGPSPIMSHRGAQKPYQVKEASLKKKRRIEITAFRRTVTISAGPPAATPGKEAPQCLDSKPCPADDPLAQLKQADLVEAILSSIDDGRSPELEHLIEALVVSNGDSARAAEQVGLSRTRFYSKLRSLGVPVIRLRKLLDTLRNRHANKRA